MGKLLDLMNKKAKESHQKRKKLEQEEKERARSHSDSILAHFIELCADEGADKFASSRKYDPKIIKRLKIGTCTSTVMSELIKTYGRENVEAAGLKKGSHFVFQKKVIIPHLDVKGYFSVKPTDISLKGKKSPYMINGKKQTIFCEGETDAIALHHIFPESKIIALKGVDSQKPIKDCQDKEISLCFDNDEAGIKGVATALQNTNAKKVNRILFSEKYKDIDEYWRDNQNTSKNYLQYKQLEIPKKDKKTTASSNINQKINNTALKDALTFIPADDRDVWLKVCIALKHDNLKNLPLFIEWSSKSDKFVSEDDCIKLWNSFDDQADKGITLGTVIYLARKNGWTGTLKLIEGLRLSKYLEESDFVIKGTIRLVFTHKNLKAIDDNEVVNIWDCTKKVSHKHLNHLSKLIYDLNTNKTYINSEEKSKKYTISDIRSYIHTTKLFADLVSAKEEFESLVESRFGNEKNIPTFEIEDRLVIKSYDDPSKTLADLKGYRQKATLDIQKIITQNVAETIVNGAVRPVFKENIFKCSFGQNTSTKLLIVEPTTKIEDGFLDAAIGVYNSKELIKLIKSWDRTILSKICSEIRVAITRGNDPMDEKEIRSAIQQRHSATKCFLKLISPFDEKQLGSLQNVKEILPLALTAGLKRDPRLDLFYLSQSFGLVQDPVQNNNLMRYMNHGISVTGTKTLKSTSARNVGKCHDRVKLAGMLGFATADERQDGAFHAQNKLQALDEISEYSDESIGQHMLGYLEEGDYHNTSGKRSRCRGSHCVTLQGNPRKTKTSDSYGFSDNSLYAMHFLDIIKRVSPNYEAMGSRIGTVLYNPSIAGTKGIPLDDKSLQKILALWDFVQCKASPIFTGLFNEPLVNKFLWQDYSPHQKEILSELARKAAVDDLKMFILSQKHNYRHLRGGALRLALFQQVDKIMVDEKIDQNKLVDDANLYTQILFDINVQSFRLLCGDINEDVYSALLLSNFYALPNRKRAVLECVAVFAIEDEGFNFSDKISIKKVAKMPKKLAKNLKKHQKNEQKFYENLRTWQIEEIFEKKLTNYLQAFNSFGVEHFVVDNQSYLVIDESKFKHIIKEVKSRYSGSNGSNGSKKNEVDTPTHSLAGTPITPNTPKKISKESLQSAIKKNDSGQGTSFACLLATTGCREPSMIDEALEVLSNEGLIIKRGRGRYSIT